MKDPSVELAVRQLNALLQDSQGHADDLSTLNSEVSGQLIQDQLVLFSEPDRCLSGLSLQISPKNAAHDCTEAIQQTPENSLSGMSKLVTKVYESTGTDSIAPSCQGTSPEAALDWLLNPEKSGSLIDRILARLVQSEANELAPHLRDDYRIAWLTVRFCQTGEATHCTPHVLATYKVLGCHPDQVWFRMQQRRQALLGQPIRIGRVTRSTHSGGVDAGESAGAAALPPKNPQAASVPNFKKETA